ncbi:MAG: cytochrome c peroxidase [Myxococcota bacterium]
MNRNLFWLLPLVATTPWSVRAQTTVAQVSAAVTPVPQTAPFSMLDNVEGGFVNVNPVAVRPMMFVPGGTFEVYALNTYLNVIQRYDINGSLADSFRTLAGPVAIGHFMAASGPNPDRLLVVCQSSDALVVHDRLTGRVLEIVYLPSQPADLVVDQAAGRAFISSLGEDVVVEIDLTNLAAPPIRYSIPSRKPMFLSMAPNGEVLVAPMLSGNNSAVDIEPRAGDPVNHSLNAQAGPLGIMDLDLLASQGLPDEDLFYVDRSTRTARPVARGTGSVLLAHQVVASSTGALTLWQLNVELNNKDAQKQSRPGIQGEIAFNRLTRMPITLPPPPVAPKARPGHVRMLDDADNNPANGIQYNSSLSVGHPFALHMLSTGYALVAGLLSDNLTLLDPNGFRVLEWDLPDGCIPRQVMTDPTETLVYTYCSGTNTIDVDWLQTTPQDVISLSLGYDPTPQNIRVGRTLFYDGGFSRDNNASCATCHVEGGVDLAAWNLSEPIFDDKGPMTTQSLFASNRTGIPYWRGSQLNGLIDFNAAFVDLLGSSRMMTAAEFAAFEAFVHSLEAPPNPHENIARVLDDAIQVPDNMSAFGPIPTGSAVNGQTLFDNGCTGCHARPTGSNDDSISTGAGFGDVKPKRQWMKIGTLLSMPERALQPVVSVVMNSGQQLDYPLLGTGTAHAGNPDNIFDFSLIFGVAPAIDLANFLFQYDNGLAPSTRIPLKLDASNAVWMPGLIQGFLEAQANAGHCDVAVFGRTTINGVQRTAGWVLDTSVVPAVYLRDDGVTQPLSFFSNQAAAGDWFVFTGLPLGTGRAFSIDYDTDDLLNGVEVAGGMFNPDTDGDGWLDGHEAANGGQPLNPSVGSNDTQPPNFAFTTAAPAWVTARGGRVSFTTDELSVWALIATPPAGSGLPTKTFFDANPSHRHSILFRGLHPNTTYTTQLIVLDLGSNQPAQSTAFSLTTRGFNDAATTAIVGDIQWTNIVRAPPQGTFTVDVQVMQKTALATPLANRRVVVRPVVNGVAAGQTGGPGLLTPGISQDYCVNGNPYSGVTSAVPGPFVVSGPSNAAGRATLTFTLTGIQPGTPIDLSVEAIAEDVGQSCTIGPLTAPDFVNPSGDGPLGWSLPDTPKSLRQSQVIF